MKRIYLDHAATTPVRAEARRAMMPHLTKKFGNPSSLHFFGQEAIVAVDGARTAVAKALHADFRDIIFTGSATEANNLALRGSVARFRERHPKLTPRVIVSAIEHEAVLETAHALQGEGAELVVIPVDMQGRADLARLKEALNDRTVIVSVMYVNNEIGTIQPVREIGELVAALRKTKPYPLFHTDAVQAFNYCACNVEALSVDMLTLSAHKIGGPKGVGALFVREREERETLAPIITGGGQEFGMRSGTENVAGIVGFAAAVTAVEYERVKEAKRLLSLKKILWAGIKKRMPEAWVHGMDEAHFSGAAPHILNVAFPNIPVDDLLVRLDMAGIAVSTGSACAARAAKGSHVLGALCDNLSRGIRFSMGRATTAGDIQEALRRLTRALPHGRIV